VRWGWAVSGHKIDDVTKGDIMPFDANKNQKSKTKNLKNL
jgi:hypothetical protein